MNVGSSNQPPPQMHQQQQQLKHHQYMIGQQIHSPIHSNPYLPSSQQQQQPPIMMMDTTMPFIDKKQQFINENLNSPMNQTAASIRQKCSKNNHVLDSNFIGDKILGSLIFKRNTKRTVEKPPK